MRNFKKVMALAISVAAICSSVSAFAELEYNVTGDLTGSYDKAANALTLNVEAAGDKTVLVLADGVEAAAATGDDILYINQYTVAEEAYKGMKLKGDDALPAGTYAIKIGYTDANGDFAIADGSLVVAEKQQEEPQYVTVLWGDIDSSNEVTINDASMLINVILGGTADTTYTIKEVVPGTNVIWGDIDSSNEVTINDASMLINVILGGTADTTYTINQIAQLPKVSE